jgi:3-oxoacyl-[acyl-carrier protein] reductase
VTSVAAIPPKRHFWGMRTAVVTGVSRRRGIGFAVARRLLSEGYAVLTTGWSAHDASQPWGADKEPLRFEAPDGRHLHTEVDLVAPEAPRRLIDLALKTFTRVDALVAVHARSSAQSLDQLTTEELDLSWAVNVRATLLLVRAFVEKHNAGSPGRVVLFTSGQHQAAMPSEIPYAASKGAVHQITATLAEAVAGRGITVNTLNPGPTDTGWADPVIYESVRKAMPAGRWNRPEDAASVVARLLSVEAASINGQIIDL